MDLKNSLVVFNNKNIRRIIHNDEWHFSIIDVVEILTESTNSRRYWSDLKIKLKDEGVELYDKIVQLKLFAEDGKMRFIDEKLQIYIGTNCPQVEMLTQTYLLNEYNEALISEAVTGKIKITGE